MRRLPPRTRLILRVTTAALAVLALLTGYRFAVMLTGGLNKENQPQPGHVKPFPVGALDSIWAIPLSAPPVSPAKPLSAQASGAKAPPSFNTAGLELKGVFVNIFDKRKSIAIISDKGKDDLILKRGDIAREGTMVDEILVDRVVLRGIMGETATLALTDFVKEAIIVGADTPSMSLAEAEDPMGPPIYDPTSPGPGMPGDVADELGKPRAPVMYMPIPPMPGRMKEGTPGVSPMTMDPAAAAISEQMNAVGRPGPETGR